MITLPVVLIAVAVLLLLALLLGLFLQRRRAARATPPGPRTVADLVQQRADREPVSAPAPVDEAAKLSTVDEPADDEPELVAAAGVDVADVEPADGEPTDDEPADELADDEPAEPGSVAGPVVAARAIAPLGDDVPWRRAAQMSGADDPEPEPAEVGRVPALALLRRPSRRPLPADARHPFVAGPRLAAVPVESTEEDSAPAVAGPVVVEPVAAEPAVAEPVDAEPVDAEPVDGAPAAAELTVAEPVSVDGEPVDGEPAGADTATAEAADAGPASAESAGATSAEQAAAEPLASTSADGEAERSVFPLTVAGLVAGGLAVGAARATGARADDEVPDEESPVGHSEPSAPGPAPETGEAAEVVHPDEMDVRGVAAAPNHSPVDLVPVDGGLLGASDRPAADTAVAGVAAPAGAATVVAATRAPSATEPDGFPSTDPDVLFDSPPVAAEPVSTSADPGGTDPAEAADAPVADAVASGAPAAEAPAADLAAIASPNPATTAPPARPPAAEAPVLTTPDAVEPLRRVPRDPEHVAAEQAAADLALLRTFGDPAARPERAPIVALEGTTRPESPRPAGSAQRVGFRAVGRSGTEVRGAAVTLLDDRGREVGAAPTAAGELTAPHPGAYVLVATAPDHQPGAVAIAVGDAPVDVEVLLVRSAALVGVVTGEDGPLAGARVTLVQDGEVVEVAETDTDGAYLVADLAAGEYAVSVASAGCEADVVLVVVPDETECVHDVELEPAGVPAG